MYEQLSLSPFYGWNTIVVFVNIIGERDLFCWKQKRLLLPVPACELACVRHDSDQWRNE
jgi:hypothetical protein